jgi:hypothetical protein
LREGAAMWGIFVPALEKMGMRVRDFDWCAGRVARAAFVAYCGLSRSRCEAWASRAKEWAVESSHVASEYEGKYQRYPNEHVYDSKSTSHLLNLNFIILFAFCYDCPFA